jgi:Zinc carboxypeptidase
LSVPDNKTEKGPGDGGLSGRLFGLYDAYRYAGMDAQHCRPAEVERALGSLVAGSEGILSMGTPGSSLEGRGIQLVTFGRGKTRVLLWSQMHGDESTATLALLDTLAFLSRSNDPLCTRLRDEITVLAVPMLNPDGAERNQRRTAANIDMNRDARALMTPEARLLKGLRDTYEPAFGFNLHDQDIHSVGQSTDVTAIALLAPASDEERTVNPVRRNAIRLAAILAADLRQFIDGHLATYDDTFEPRAFGDNMQAWGTSTVLIESGHWPGDPGKEFPRKLNFVCLVRAFSAIASGEYRNADSAPYTSLIPNGRKVYDCIIRDVILEHMSGWTCKVDVAVTRSAGNSASRSATVKDVGDLSTYGSLASASAKGRRISSQLLVPDVTIPMEHLLDEESLRLLC